MHWSLQEVWIKKGREAASGILLELYPKAVLRKVMKAAQWQFWIDCLLQDVTEVTHVMSGAEAMDSRGQGAASSDLA